jgi:large conductance mechanosensitive channel
MKKYWSEFRQFAVKGNVVDLAVAVIIGGAFGKIVSSFVNDIVMPLVGVILGGVDLTGFKWVIAKEVLDESGAQIQSEVAVNIGMFLQNIIDFLIIALAIFIMIKIITKTKEKIKKKEEEKQEQEPELSEEQKLLTEIRDILKNK